MKLYQSTIIWSQTQDSDRLTHFNFLYQQQLSNPDNTRLSPGQKHRCHPVRSHPSRSSGSRTVLGFSVTVFPGFSPAPTVEELRRRRGKPFRIRIREIALSRRQHRFESGRGRQSVQQLTPLRRGLCPGRVPVTGARVAIICRGRRVGEGRPVLSRGWRCGAVRAREGGSAISRHA